MLIELNYFILQFHFLLSGLDKLDLFCVFSLIEQLLWVKKARQTHKNLAC